MTPPKKGDVWTYEHLWRCEHGAGAEDGRKPRPTALVAIAISFGQDGRTNLFMLPVTTSEPGLTGVHWKSPNRAKARGTCL